MENHLNAPEDDDERIHEASGDTTSLTNLISSSLPPSARGADGGVTIHNPLSPAREAGVTPILMDTDETSADFPFNYNAFNESTTVSTETVSLSASAPLLAVVSIIAFLTIVLLFIGMIRYRFCKRASYKINEIYEMDDVENGTKLIAEEPKSVVTVYGGKVKKEWLV